MRLFHNVHNPIASVRNEVEDTKDEKLKEIAQFLGEVLFLQSADKQLLSTKPLQRIYKELQRFLSSACFAGYENISVQMEQRL